MASARDRAISILELLVKNVRGLPMHEIADQLGIPRTAASRLLAELKEMRYVKQEPGSPQYMLTVKLASLGLSYLAASGITDAAQPMLDDLADSTGELARLAVVEGDELIWVAKAQGARTGLRYDPDSGSDVYLPATANGLALLAAVSEERALQLIASQGMDKAATMGPGAPSSMRELMDRIAQTRERGYAVVYEAYEAGTSAIAAAICRDSDGAPVGTVSIAGPSIRVTPERLAVLAPAVQECAQRLAAISARSAAFARH